jgi:protein-disulfide isomerase
MHDLLYANQGKWTLVPFGIGLNQYFDSLATSLNLDVKKFDVDINSAQVKNKIQADVLGANAAQVDHTPTFFVNLKQIPNPTSYAEFKTILENALGPQSK